MKKKQNIKHKKGLSLVVLIITIILLLILTTAVIVSTQDNVDNARLSSFANEINQIQDAVDSYYIINNSLPTTSETLTIEEVKNLIDSNYITDFVKEVELNLDTNAIFYNIDLSLIEIQNADKIDLSKKSFVISYPNLNVYSLNVTEIKNVGYFSITSKINGIFENTNENDNIISKIQTTNGVGLVVKSNTSINTNKLGISVSIDSFDASADAVFIEISNIAGQKKVKTDKSANFLFNTIEELVSNSILEETLTTEDISKFNMSSNKKINIVAKRNDEEIARENLDVSNYDIIKPTVILDDFNVYDEMISLRIKVNDDSSGVKEIRYDYLKKKDEDDNILDYYEGVTSFDKEYMKTKAKVISVDNIVNGVVDIKIPVEVYTTCVVVIDNAGNISDFLNIDL